MLKLYMCNYLVNFLRWLYGQYNEFCLHDNNWMFRFGLFIGKFYFPHKEMAGNFFCDILTRKYKSCRTWPSVWKHYCVYGEFT